MGASGALETLSGVCKVKTISIITLRCCLQFLPFFDLESVEYRQFTDMALVSILPLTSKKRSIQDLKLTGRMGKRARKKYLVFFLFPSLQFYTVPPISWK